jgi:hypothetical protein
MLQKHMRILLDNVRIPVDRLTVPEIAQIYSEAADLGFIVQNNVIRYGGFYILTPKGQRWLNQDIGDKRKVPYIALYNSDMARMFKLAGDLQEFDIITAHRQTALRLSDHGFVTVNRVLNHYNSNGEYVPFQGVLTDLAIDWGETHYME